MSLDGAPASMDTISCQDYNQKIEDMKKLEYPMLQDEIYLDHAGTTLCPKSLINAFSRDMMSSLLGNPHSASSSSQLSSRRIENVRVRVLKLFNADPDQFDVVFVANATAGIKLVIDAFREHKDGFWYGYHQDAHTSLVGAREVAGAGHRCFESREVEDWLSGRDVGATKVRDSALQLFAYPAQSNMNGRRLPLNWPKRFREPSAGRQNHIYTLLDAAAFVSTSPLDLSDHLQAPDFTCLSFYKIFGFPDLGALIVRKDSSNVLRQKKYFGGGTVEMVTCKEEEWHSKKEGSVHEQLEDGTLPIHSIIALDNAIAVHHNLFGTLHLTSAHTSFLALRLYTGLASLRHGNGRPVSTLYKDSSASYENSQTQGPTIAFNLQNSRGVWVSCAEVEKLAVIKKIHLRSGGLCNPGGIASWLGLSPWEMKRNFVSGHRCGSENDIIGGRPTGMLRVSFGAMSTMRDVNTFLKFVNEFFIDHQSYIQAEASFIQPPTNLYVNTLMIFPIKSCGGWRIPDNVTWDIRAEGLAWDREWCLVHQSSRAALSQKRYPKMALLKPSMDFDKGVLRIVYHGCIPSATPHEIVIPLSADPALFQESSGVSSCPIARVCGDSITAQTYRSTTTTSFFTNILGVPCYLARCPSSGLGPSMRHSKPHLRAQQSQSLAMPGSFPSQHQPPSLSHPLLLSNESPILTISRSSLNRLNETIKARSPSGKAKAASAELFRANIIVAENPLSPSGIERPYDEDNWLYMTTSSKEDGVHSSTTFEVLGACRRCQMICIDQNTAEKNEEPFVTLAKTRRVDGKVIFGVHMGLVGGVGRIRVGDRVRGVGDGEGEAE
ncbi:MAG: hypothetical protein MMC33_000498 [Icmadophila ericetorum]|nr:hypothetical protein [Icmadophila ericetorum]